MCWTNNLIQKQQNYVNNEYNLPIYIYINQIIK